jgi:hypothetical protein
MMVRSYRWHDPLNSDTDGDGVNDGQEATDGTDPLNSEYRWRWVSGQKL